MTQGTSFKAFHGDAAVRDALLQNLAKHIEVDAMTNGMLFMGGGRYTPAAALVDTTDAAVWQQKTGVAAWVAYALDALVVGDSAEASAQVFGAIAPGQDAANLGSLVIDATLAKLECKQPALDEARGVLRALHQRAAMGDAPSNAQWRAARKHAAEVLEKSAEGPEKLEATCIESAAWSPVVAPTSVAEVLHSWTKLVDVDLALGWNQERHDKTKAKLDEMYRLYIAPNPEEKRDVFRMLEEHDPQWAKDIRDYMAGKGRIVTEQTRLAREILVDVLKKSA